MLTPENWKCPELRAAVDAVVNMCEQTEEPRIDKGQVTQEECVKPHVRS